MVRILILEDDLEAVSKLLNRLKNLELKLKIDFSVMVLSEYTQAEWLNKTDMEFDIILLDRDCKAACSFHVLNIEKFGIERVISISSIPAYNQQASVRGVSKVIWKNFEDLMVLQIKQSNWSN